MTDQIERRGVRSSRVLAAIRSVPRHFFVPERLYARAYDDCPLPIGLGQTISQPYIVALMTQLLGLEGNEKVLEVGTGSGYQAAVLARLAREIHTVEYLPELARMARRTLDLLEIGNVHVHVADGSLGYPSEAPYDAILIAAAAPRAPQCVLEQLCSGGRLVLPVGPPRAQILQRWERRGDNFEPEDILPVAFVPLRGKNGWQYMEWEED